VRQLIEQDEYFLRLGFSLLPFDHSEALLILFNLDLNGVAPLVIKLRISTSQHLRLLGFDG